MPFDAFRFKVFSRRVFIVLSLQFVAFFVIIARLFKFQVIDYNYFKSKSDSNRIKTEILPPLRGIIYDRNNKIVATNTSYYRVLLQKTSYKKDLETIKNLAKVLQFKEEGLSSLIKEYNRNKVQKEIIIYRHLTRKELVNIEFNLHLLPNLSVGLGNARTYTNSFAYSSLLGYVILPPYKKSKEHLNHPDIKIGAEGIEKFYNKELMGQNGFKYSEVNVAGLTIEEFKKVEPIEGKNIKVSFNSLIQSFAYELAKNVKASIVLLNIITGEVLAFVSTPSFDINSLSQKIDSTSWSALVQNPLKPLLNRAVQSAYATGSIHKIVTSLVALEEGMNVNEFVNCKGEAKYYGMVKKCWLDKKGHGKMNLHDAIKHSCNIMFYNIGSFAKIETFYRIAKELGIGEEFKDFEFKNQNIGINPNNEWKKKNLKEIWYPGDTLNLAIGQGFVRANALQLAILMARVASIGKKVVPTLKLAEANLTPNFENIEIEPYYINFVKNALFDATNTKGGTSYYSRITEKGMEFAGKTGTAQVVSKFLEKHEYTEATRPHGIFAGFAPFENSKFSIAVTVENGGFGSSSAAPIGKNILYFTQLLEGNRFEEAKKFALKLGIKLKEFI